MTVLALTLESLVWYLAGLIIGADDHVASLPPEVLHQLPAPHNVSPASGNRSTCAENSPCAYRTSRRECVGYG
eukprot:3004550-Rhodomonas_salina.1